MTAEIVIMNKEAVALAADSAVTLQRAGLQKVSIAANKIFKLSMSYPVGIMIYGNAQFMGLPWETIVKAYRANRGGKKFDSIKQYGKDFVAYLISNNITFDKKAEETYIESFAASSFSEIRDNIGEEIGELIEAGTLIDKKVVHSRMKTAIVECYNFYRVD